MCVWYWNFDVDLVLKLYKHSKSKPAFKSATERPGPENNKNVFGFTF